MQDFLGDAVAEILVLGIAAHVDEGQHGDGFRISGRGSRIRLLHHRRPRLFDLRQQCGIAPRRQHEFVEV